MTNLSALRTMISSQLGNENVRKSKRTITMLATLILSAMFFAGFFAGYATRAWRSHKRGTNYLMYPPPYRSKPPTTTFGHARRPF
jgi:Ubiquinol-cytochrome C reductase, UQCRX/QCR9 like